MCAGTTCGPRQAAPAAACSTRMRRICCGTARCGRKLERGGAPGSCRRWSGGAGPCDALAGMPAPHKLVALGTVGGGRPPARGRVPVQAAHDDGMYLAVLTARYARTHLGGLGQGEALFPRHLAPGGRGGYPWQDLCGPLPQLSAEHSTQHIVRGSAQHTMHSTNRQRVQRPVHGREQHVVHSAQRATLKAQADRCPCAKAARPRCILWGCQYGSPPPMNRPLGRPTP